MKRAVRGKSWPIRATTSVTSAAPPATWTARPAGGASAEAGSRSAATRSRPWAALGPYGVVTVKTVRSPLVVAARAAAANRSGGPPGVA